MIKTIQGLKAVNKKWFTPENKRFFNDINYKVLTRKKTKTRFLIGIFASPIGMGFLASLTRQSKYDCPVIVSVFFFKT